MSSKPRLPKRRNYKIADVIKCTKRMNVNIGQFLNFAKQFCLPNVNIPTPTLVGRDRLTSKVIT